jgi:hypothetical protein
MPLPPASVPNTARAFEFQGEGFRFPVPGPWAALFLVLGSLCFVRGEGIQSFCLHLSAEKGFGFSA